MIEELKIVAEILKGIRQDALYGLIFYMIVSYLKPTTIAAITGYSFVKMIQIATSKEDPKYVEFINKDEI